MKTICMVLLAACCAAAYAQGSDELNALKAQKELLDVQAGIEEAKAKLAKAKQDQIKAGRDDVTEAVLAKKKAEAEKSALAAKLPAVESKAPQGTFGVEGAKLLALPPVIKMLDEQARELCNLLTKPVLPYDKGIVDGMIAAQVIEDQIEKLIDAYDEVEKVRQGPTPAGKSPLLLLGAATTGVKAAADLASLFKSNIVTGKVELTEARSLFLTMMAGHCGAKFAYLPGGYIGELELSTYRGLSARVKELVSRRYAVERLADQKKVSLTEGKVAEKKQEERIAELKKRGAQATAAEREELGSLTETLALRTRENQQIAREVAAFEDLVKQTDVFLAGLKITDPAGSGPLLAAARYLALSRATSATLQVLDLDVRAEGVTILKENVFTGQRLRIGGAAVLSYRVLAKNGSVERAKVIPLSTDFTELDLRK